MAGRESEELKTKSGTGGAQEEDKLTRKQVKRAQ
jgi:hypothetical protein